MQGTEFLVVLGSGAFLLGLAVTIWMWVTKQRGYGTPNWPSVSGMVVKASVVPLERETPEGMTSTFTPVVEYAYQVDGSPYAASRLDFMADEHHTYETREAATEAIAPHTSGTPVDVFYNPANPKQAALSVPRPVAHNAVLGFGITNLIAGAVIVTLGIVLL